MAIRDFYDYLDGEGYLSSGVYSDGGKFFGQRRSLKPKHFSDACNILQASVKDPAGAKSYCRALRSKLGASPKALR